MTTKQIEDLKQKRAAAVTAMRATLNKAQAENRDLNTEEQSSYDNAEKDVDRLGKQIDREEGLARHENALRAKRDGNYRPGLAPVKDGVKDHPTNSAEYCDAFFNEYSRKGKNGLTADVLNVMTVGTSTDAGYLVPQEFETNLLEYLLSNDPIRAGATIIQTRSDRNIPIETAKGTFAYIAEGGTYGKVDPAVARVVLSAYKSGGIVQISEELLQDSFFDLPSYLGRLAGERYMKLGESMWNAGAGTTQPLGIFSTTAVGGVSLGNNQGAVSATPIIASDDLINTYHSLTRAYRTKASWITSDTMVKMIRKLKDTLNQYLWQPGLVAGAPDTLLGRPVLVSDYAPAPAVNTQSIAFGDLSYYYIGDRLGMTMQRLNELYAEAGQVGFKFTKRDDGKLMDGHAFTFFQHGTAS